MVDHFAGGSAFVGEETKHGVKEGGDGVGLGFGEEVFVVQDGFEGPKAKFADVSEFAWNEHGLVEKKIWSGEVG